MINQEDYIERIKEDRICPDGYYVYNEADVQDYIRELFYSFNNKSCSSCENKDCHIFMEALNSKKVYSSSDFCCNLWELKKPFMPYE